MSVNAASTSLAFLTLMAIADKARPHAAKETLCVSFIKSAVSRTLDLSWGNRGLDFGKLIISASGLVSNFQSVISSKHRNLLQSWGQQWASMSDDLSSSWSDTSELPLMDVVMFIILANKRRREQKKKSWKRASSELLDEMKNDIGMALQAVVHVNIFSNFQSYEGHPLPSRGMKRSRTASVVCFCVLRL